MKKETVLAKLNELSAQEEFWKAVEVFSDKNGVHYPVTFHNVIYKEGDICIFMLAVGGHAINIFIMQEEAGKFEFAVSCGIDNDWFSSKSLAECIDFAEAWFLEHK